MKKRIVAMLLVLVMVLSLAGCSSDTKKLVGTWRCEIDMTDYLTESLLEGNAEMEPYISMDDVVLVYYAEFKEDATFRMYADEDQLEKAFEDLGDDLIDGLAAYMEDMFYEETGMEMSVEEIMELADMSMEDLRDSLGLEAIAGETCAELYMEGKYKADSGKLHMSAGLDYNVDPAVYETYTLEDNVLTIAEGVGTEVPDFNPYPMVFKKIG